MQQYTWRWGAAALTAIAIATLAACGGGDDDNNTGGGSTPTLQTPTLAFTAPGNTVDLSNYTRTGRYALPIPSGAASSPNLLAQEASAITYNKDTDTLFVVGDGSTAVVQIDKQGKLIDSMTLAAGTSPQGTSFYDTEGISYVGAGKFVLVQERYRAVSQIAYAPGTTLAVDAVPTVTLGTTVGNIGIEGITYDPLSGGYIGVKEATPEGIFQAGIDFTALTATNGSPTTDNPTNLFDPAKAGLSAFSDVFALSNVLPAAAPDYGQLLIISGPDGKVVQVDRSGTLVGSLDIGVAPQSEGLTMDKDRIIYVVNEIGGGTNHPQLFVYAPTIDATAVGVGSNLYLSFNAPVAVGTGNLTLANDAGDTRTIAVTDTTQVVISGSTVRIDPAADLVPNTTYHITYASGLVKDAAGNAAPAVTDATALRFKSFGVVDTTPPKLESSVPADNAAGVTVGPVILTFDEPVAAGNGNIVISDGAADVRTIAVGDTTQVAFDGVAVTITPTGGLHAGRAYNVQFAAGVVKDSAGNAFAGITDPTSLNFTLAAAAPTTLAAGDLLFMGANTSSPDAFAFVLLKAVTAGTQVGFTDKDYNSAATPPFPGNESIMVWTADVDYPAGTIVTIQPDQASGTAPLASKGSTVGVAGGLSGSSETIYAFQGNVAGLTNTTYTTITVDRFLAAINIGTVNASGEVPAGLAAVGAYIALTPDNVRYAGSLDTSDLAAFAALVKNPASWGSSATPYPVTGGSLFP